MRNLWRRLRREERGAIDDMVMWFFGLLLAGAVIAGAMQAVQVARAEDALQAAARVLAQGASGTGCLTKEAEGEAAQTLRVAGVPASQVAFLQSPDGQQPYGGVLTVGVDFAMPTAFGSLPLRARQGAVSEYVPGVQRPDCALAASGASYNGSAPQLNTISTYGTTNPPPAGACTATVWVDDSLPPGAVPQSDGGDAWSWEGQVVHTGSLAQQSSDSSGEHQHSFTDGAVLSVPETGLLSVWVWIPPATAPQEIMLQWTTDDGGDGWSHRAYWGADALAWGTEGTASRFAMGPIPAARSQWVELAVPAADVGLQGQSVDGMAFTLYGGSLDWDTAGVDCLPATGANGLAGGWQVSLVASDPRPLPGQSVTLTATADQDVGPTPFVIQILDATSGQTVATCRTGSTCTASVSEPAPTTQSYRAEVLQPDGTGVQAQSSVTVTWAWPPPVVTGFTLSPDPAWVGQAVTAAVTTENPTSAVTIVLPWTGQSVALSGGGGSWSATFAAPMQSGAYTLTATATGPGGQASRSATLTVQAPQAPQVNWSGAPGTYTAGWGGTVSWSFNPPAYDGYRGWSQGWDSPDTAAPEFTTASGSLGIDGLQPGAHHVVLAFFFAAGYVAEATSPAVTIQPPPQWSVSLSASATQVQAGQSVILTATSNASVTGTPFYLEVYDESTGQVVGRCGGGSTCSAQVSESSPASQTYVGQVAGYGGSGVQARSSPVTVIWTSGIQVLYDQSVDLGPNSSSFPASTTLDGQHALVLHLTDIVTDPEFISYSLVALQDTSRGGWWGDYAVGYGTSWAFYDWPYAQGYSSDAFYGFPAYVSAGHVTCAGCTEQSVTVSLVPSGSGFAAYYATSAVPDQQARSGAGMRLLTGSPDMYDGDGVGLVLENWWPDADWWDGWQAYGNLTGGVELDRVPVPSP